MYYQAQNVVNQKLKYNPTDQIWVIAYHTYDGILCLFGSNSNVVIESDALVD